VCYLFTGIPGIAVRRNSRDRFGSREIDITVANAGITTWMKLFPNALLVECKNWDSPVDVTAVTDFIFKLMETYIEVGILIAANGITGDQDSLKASYHRIAIAQSKGHRVIVITLDELRSLKTSGDFEALLRDGFLKLVGSGAF